MSEQEQGVDEETANTGETPSDPPLNREQRRAQAKGKKGTGGAINPAVPHSGNLRGPGTGGAAPGGQARFQRKTGGK